MSVGGSFLRPNNASLDWVGRLKLKRKKEASGWLNHPLQDSCACSVIERGSTPNLSSTNSIGSRGINEKHFDDGVPKGIYHIYKYITVSAFGS